MDKEYGWIGERIARDRKETKGGKRKGDAFTWLTDPVQAKKPIFNRYSLVAAQS